MKKYFIIFFLISFYGKLLSQIGLKIEVIDRVKDNYTLEVRIKNASEDNYILPIDIEKYRLYMPEDICFNIEEVGITPFLGFIPKIISKEQTGFLEGMVVNKDVLDKKLLRFSNRKSIVESRKKKKELSLWKRVNHINKSRDWVEINKYLYNNILVLESKQEMVFVRKFNPNKIDEVSESFLYYYFLEKGKDYQLFFEVCISPSINDYLTLLQKESFKNYKLYTGIIKSNQIDIRINK